MKNTLLKLYQNQIFIWFCYLVVAGLLYFRVLNNFFASDDFHWLSLAKNRPWDWSIFVTNYEGLRFGGSYNPVLFILWKIFYNIFHLHYQWYHLFSILLHATNAWLVYILAKNLLARYQVRSAYWASVSGLFFLIWPVQVEVVSWIAAWPHLWATFFYLLSSILYLQFLTKKNISSILASIIFFILALFTKEIAMTLPVAILIFSWQQKSKIDWKKIWPYFIILVVFFALRWQATGQLFGYYGQTSLGFKVVDYIGNLAVMSLDWASAGYFRSLAYQVWYHFPWILVISLSLFLLVYILYLWRSRKIDRLYIFVLLLLTCLPVLPLGLHRSTFAGERYLYLPTVFFVIWFFSVIANLRVNIKIKMFIVFFIAICSMVIINNKNIIWFKAAHLSEQIVSSYKDLDLESGTKLISVALPDNLQGAEVFRNNLQQALELYYPDGHPEILSLPVYVQLRDYDVNRYLLHWRMDDKGWFLESVDHSFIVTGLTSITVNQVYFELWHYNYQNFTANLIRLIPEADLLSSFQDGTIHWLTFDQGKLRIGK